jgi:hypothetical protein
VGVWGVLELFFVSGVGNFWWRFSFSFLSLSPVLFLFGYGAGLLLLFPRFNDSIFSRLSVFRTGARSTTQICMCVLILRIRWHI